MLQQNHTIKYWAEDDRPREKLLQKGRKQLTDSELIAILLQNGTRNRTALDIAKEILALCGNSLVEFSNKTIQDFCQVKGIGTAKAIKLIAAIELGKRRKEIEVPRRLKINSSKLAFELVRSYLDDLRHEEFYVLYLNGGNQVQQIKRLSVGGISGTIVDKRLIFKEALDCYATGIILAHNHPSGRINPSDQDKKLTLKLVEIGNLMEIFVLDHLIIGADSYYSFADAGII
ncbi:MAG: repair protein RadC [Crocinitomicaceae bacterium]|jgi:DNA repair protein RadC|nr:repair protein RadC [Crocinitomicaceae bacterium]